MSSAHPLPRLGSSPSAPKTVVEGRLNLEFKCNVGNLKNALVD